MLYNITTNLDVDIPEELEAPSTKEYVVALVAKLKQIFVSNTVNLSIIQIVLPDGFAIGDSDNRQLLQNLLDIARALAGDVVFVIGAQFKIVSCVPNKVQYVEGFLDNGLSLIEDYETFIDDFKAAVLKCIQIVEVKPQILLG